MKTQHTPTPWEVFGPSVRGLVIRRGNLDIAMIPQEISSQDELNAAFIVRAVNAHEELVDLVKRAFIMLDRKPGSEKWYGDARQAIAKAEGKA